jgi:hypothetical protein
MSKVKAIISKQPSATVNFYDMPDGMVMTAVDMYGEYRGTEAQKMAMAIRFNPELHITYRHIKTGGIYIILCRAKDESSNVDLVVYGNIETLDSWTRPATEFYDGRFVRVEDET